MWTHLLRTMNMYCLCFHLHSKYVQTLGKKIGLAVIVFKMSRVIGCRLLYMDCFQSVFMSQLPVSSVLLGDQGLGTLKEILG